MVGEAPAKDMMKESFAERLPRLRAVLRRLGLEEHGTALVEFALIAPVLFLLIFGVLDFSLALNAYNQESQLVGLGARAAAVNRNPDGTAFAAGSNSIQTQLNGTYAQGGLRNNTAICIALPNGSAVGSPVQVMATYHFHLLPLFSAIPGLGSTITITAAQTERQEVAFNGSWKASCP
jgi:hypothetical protein